MADRPKWRWTDENGVQRLVSEDELRDALRQGRLGPETLVWRRGMRNWKPAQELETFTAELKANDPMEVSMSFMPGNPIQPTPSIPPAPNLRSAQEIPVQSAAPTERAAFAADPLRPRPLSADLLSGSASPSASLPSEDSNSRWGGNEKTVTTVLDEEAEIDDEAVESVDAESIRGVPRSRRSLPRRPVIANPPTAVSKLPPLPTHASHSAVLDPAVMASPVGVEEAARPRTLVSNEVPDDAGANESRKPMRSLPPRRETRPPPIESLSGLAPPPEGSVPAMLTGVAASPSLAAPRIPTEMPPAFKLPPQKILAMAGGAAAVLALLSFAIGRSSSSEEELSLVSRIAPAASWMQSSALNDQKRACLMLRAPARLAGLASRSLIMETAGTDDGRVALGYAEGPDKPRGLVVDTTTGETKVVFQEQLEGGRLSRVTPYVEGNDFKFAVVGEKAGKVMMATSLPSRPSTAIVGSASGKLATFENGKTTTLWPLASSAPVQALVAAQDKTGSLRGGAALAYRESDKIWYGQLKPDGSVMTPGKALPTPDGKVGRPSVAVSGNKVSVVFAHKAGGAPADLKWASGELGGELFVETVARRPGGPGGDAIAPVIARVGDDRWLLLWTEGSQGSRTLRAQTYDLAGQPIGDALRVSPATGSFGQGTIGVAHGRAVVSFLLSSGRSYQLWGTVLQCE